MGVCGTSKEKAPPPLKEPSPATSGTASDTKTEAASLPSTTISETTSATTTTSAATTKTPEVEDTGSCVTGTFTLYSEENAHQGEGNLTHGEYNNYGDAARAAKTILETSLRDALKKGTTPEQWEVNELGPVFGVDYWILSPTGFTPKPNEAFDCRKYAKELVQRVNRGETKI